MSSYYYSDAGTEIVKEVDHREPRQLRYFSFFTALSQIFGFLMLFFTGYWSGTYNGGYKWGRGTDNPHGNLPYHATFMTYGLIFLQGEAILMYRMFRHERKVFAKFLHGLFHLFAFVLLIFGLIAIVTQKNNINQKHMFSAHSWIGVSVVVVYTIQYIAGFINFAFPKTSPAVRAWFLPIHRAIGLIIFTVSCAQVLFGVMQAIWILTFTAKNDYFKSCYSMLDCHGQGLVINFNVVFTILYAVTVVYLASSKKYRRDITHDEEEEEL